MIARSSFAVFLIFILFIHTFYAINPAYFQEQQQLASLIEDIHKQIDEQHSNSASSETNENSVDDDDQFIKRNKYTKFHLSPLWLSRRTRTNRFYGKPLWISRTG
jgi:hypothetical protein